MEENGRITAGFHYEENTDKIKSEMKQIPNKENDLQL